MTTLLTPISEQNVGPLPPNIDEDVEPDAQWKESLRARIEQTLQPMVDKAREDRDAQLRGVHEGTLQWENVMKSYNYAMDRVRRLAQDQFTEELKIARFERSLALGKEVEGQEFEEFKRRQQAIWDTIKKGGAERQQGPAGRRDSSVSNSNQENGEPVVSLPRANEDPAAVPLRATGEQDAREGPSTSHREPRPLARGPFGPDARPRDRTQSGGSEQIAGTPGSYSARPARSRGNSSVFADFDPTNTNASPSPYDQGSIGRGGVSSLSKTRPQNIWLPPTPTRDDLPSTSTSRTFAHAAAPTVSPVSPNTRENPSNDHGRTVSRAGSFRASDRPSPIADFESAPIPRDRFGLPVDDRTSSHKGKEPERPERSRQPSFTQQTLVHDIYARRPDPRVQMPVLVPSARPPPAPQPPEDQQAFAQVSPQNARHRTNGFEDGEGIPIRAARRSNTSDQGSPEHMRYGPQKPASARPIPSSRRSLPGETDAWSAQPSPPAHHLFGPQSPPSVPTASSSRPIPRPSSADDDPRRHSPSGAWHGSQSPPNVLPFAGYDLPFSSSPRYRGYAGSPAGSVSGRRNSNGNGSRSVRSHSSRQEFWGPSDVSQRPLATFEEQSVASGSDSEEDYGVDLDDLWHLRERAELRERHQLTWKLVRDQEREEVMRKAAEAKRLEEEARRKEEEARRKEEEARRKEEEARRKADEARRKEEEVRLKALEIQQKQEELARREAELLRREMEAKLQEERRKREELEAALQQMREAEERRRQEEAERQEREMRREERERREKEERDRREREERERRESFGRRKNASARRRRNEIGRSASGRNGRRRSERRNASAGRRRSANGRSGSAHRRSGSRERGRLGRKLAGEMRKPPRPRLRKLDSRPSGYKPSVSPHSRLRDSKRTQRGDNERQRLRGYEKKLNVARPRPNDNESFGSSSRKRPKPKRSDSSQPRNNSNRQTRSNSDEVPMSCGRRRRKHDDGGSRAGGSNGRLKSDGRGPWPSRERQRQRASNAKWRRLGSNVRRRKQDSARWTQRQRGCVSRKPLKRSVCAKMPNPSQTMSSPSSRILISSASKKRSSRASKLTVSARPASALPGNARKKRPGSASSPGSARRRMPGNRPRSFGSRKRRTGEHRRRTRGVRGSSKPVGAPRMPCDGRRNSRSSSLTQYSRRLYVAQRRSISSSNSSSNNNRRSVDGGRIAWAVYLIPVPAVPGRTILQALRPPLDPYPTQARPSTTVRLLQATVVARHRPRASAVLQVSSPLRQGGPTPPVTPVPRVGLLLHQPPARLRSVRQGRQAPAVLGNLLYPPLLLSRPRLPRRQAADLRLVPIRPLIVPVRIPSHRTAHRDLLHPIRPMRP
ncbi:hypothetical protein BD311DRAFT_38093 [Dichomitus squalens]|uniref:Uncharacterized protein n=1 Tax=Dichomitus squalens TaxID=114155 RepID=A0A4V6MVT6_9APHY|nr:hypothetical protein BD311DRAFT_38093 [Dichomitus squalens]